MSDQNGVKEFDVTELYNESVNEDQQKQVASEMLLDAGMYDTVPPVNFKGLVVDHDEYPNGRRLITAFVRVKHRDTGKNGAIGLRLSPDPAKNTYDGKPDRATQLYTRAVSAAKRAGVYDGTVGSVIKMLSDYPAPMRIIKFSPPDGEPRNIIMSVG